MSYSIQEYINKSCKCSIKNCNGEDCQTELGKEIIKELATTIPSYLVLPKEYEFLRERIRKVENVIINNGLQIQRAVFCNINKSIVFITDRGLCELATIDNVQNLTTLRLKKIIRNKIESISLKYFWRALKNSPNGEDFYKRFSRGLTNLNDEEKRYLVLEHFGTREKFKRSVVANNDLTLDELVSALSSRDKVIVQLYRKSHKNYYFLNFGLVLLSTMPLKYMKTFSY